jgi:predicted esterase
MRREHHLTVPRTARYYVVGDPDAHVRELWIACHGYGQLAGDFAENFEAIASDGRIVIVPEALSRFYHDHPLGGSHQHSAVGASWMTREDRVAEIGDQVAYLDRLLQEFQERLGTLPPVTIFGFSQGVATACRWLARTSYPARRLVCWGGSIPDDVHPAHLEVLRTMDIVLVNGLRDGVTHAERARTLYDRLVAAGLRVELLLFDGGHRLDDETLTVIVNR